MMAEAESAVSLENACRTSGAKALELSTLVAVVSSERSEKHPSTNRLFSLITEN